jgi:SpoVK/Ycf46/Vps4 family AAA+-type ATPase
LLDLATIYPVEIPAPDYAGQKALWEMHLNGNLAASSPDDLEELTARFDLTAGQIASAVHHAEQAALARDPEIGRLTPADLLASSRTQSQPKLSTLARKIEAKYCWGDLVLPEEQMQKLRELASQVQHRQRVMSEWGFADRLSLGHGLNALFAGPSGTGKTMAAEVIAGHLGLDLYKIDLAAGEQIHWRDRKESQSRL